MPYFAVFARYVHLSLFGMLTPRSTGVCEIYSNVSEWAIELNSTSARASQGK